MLSDSQDALNNEVYFLFRKDALVIIARNYWLVDCFKLAIY